MLRTGANIKITAVAGSGKTSTILHIANANRKKKIMSVMYNKALQVETRKKCKDLKVDVDAMTFHGTCSRLYGRQVMNDTNIEEFLREKARPHRRKYDIIMIDEAQDMSLIFYILLTRIIKDNGKSPQICILGDCGQMINSFRGATAKFIISPEDYFCNGRPWESMKLDVSFRITYQISDFLNHCIVKQDAPFQDILATKSGPTVKYMICNPFRDVIKKIYELLKTERPGDILILAPTVNTESNNPLKIIENSLVRSNYSVARIRNDQEIFNEKFIEGRVAILTFNAAKGLQRKHVFVMNFDDSYEKYFLRTPTDSCPNILYVALTRASHQLFLVHGETRNFLRMLQPKQLNKYVEFIGSPNVIEDLTKPQDKPWSVTNLIRHIPHYTLRWCMNFVTVEVLEEEEEPCDIPVGLELSKGGVEFVEDVSAINGTAIVMYYEYLMHGRCQIVEIFKQILKDHEQAYSDPRNLIIDSRYIYVNGMKYATEVIGGIRNCLREYKEDPNMGTFLFVANVYSCLTSGYLDSLFNLSINPDNYDWIDQDTSLELLQRVERAVGEHGCVNGRFEEAYACGKIKGRVDFINKRNIFEFKCKQTLGESDVLQLAIYAYLVHRHEGKKRRNILYNILTNEKLEIKVEMDDVEKIIEKLLKVKEIKCEECYGCDGECDEYIELSQFDKMCDGRFDVFLREMLFDFLVVGHYTMDDIRELVRCSIEDSDNDSDGDSEDLDSDGSDVASWSHKKLLLRFEASKHYHLLGDNILYDMVDIDMDSDADLVSDCESDTGTAGSAGSAGSIARAMSGQPANIYAVDEDWI